MTADVEVADGPLVCDALAHTLKAERETLNASFAKYRVAGHQIDVDAFLQHVASVIDPIVRRVSDTIPERTRATVNGLFEISLELFATSLLGPTANIPEVAQVWQQLLPAIPRIVARDPAGISGRLCNAVYNIARQPAARPAAWVRSMIRLSAACRDPETLLECGQVLAWQAGMVQYRAAAFGATKHLDPTLVARLLDLPAGTSAATTRTALAKMEADPWLHVGQALTNEPPEPSIACVGTVGAFRGFGGHFLRPPVVDVVGDRFRVSDGLETYELLADVHGHLLSRCQPLVSQSNRARHGAAIDRAGTVCIDTVTREMPELASSTSSAWDGTTLAVTLSTSHHVFLLAKQ